MDRKRKGPPSASNGEPPSEPPDPGDDPSPRPPTTKRQRRLPLDSCALCGERGHNTNSHDFTCGALVCDNADHGHEDHTETCQTRRCGEQGHTARSHASFCEQCQQRGHETESHHLCHDGGSDRDKVCGYVGHKGKNSTSCPFYEPTEKKIKRAEVAGAAGVGKNKIAIVKMALGSFLKDRSLFRAVESMVDRSTQMLVEASELMNGYFLWCLHENKPLPNLSKEADTVTMINRAFMLVTRDENEGRRGRPPKSSGDLDQLGEFYRVWWAPRTLARHSKALRRNMDQVLTILAGQYRVAMTNHVTTNLLGRLKRYARWRIRLSVQTRFTAAGTAIPTVLAKKKNLDLIAGHWIARLAMLGPDAPYTLPPSVHGAIEASGVQAQLACSLAWQDLERLLGGMSLKEDDVEKDWHRWFHVLVAVNAEFRTHRAQFLAEVATWDRMSVKTRRQRLRADPRHGKLLRSFSLLPHHSVKAKYVQFDTKALRQLYKEAAALRNQAPTPLPESDDELWAMAVHKDVAETARRAFDSRFSTDGVSCSIQITKPRPPAAAEKKKPIPKKKKGNTDEEEPYDGPKADILEGKRLVVLDEGRIDLYRGVVSGTDAGLNAFDDTVVGCSTKEYYQRTGFTDSAKRRNAWKAQGGHRRGRESIVDIESITPPKDVATLEEYELYIDHQYRYLPRLLSFYGQRKWRRERFNAYMGRRSVQNQLCDEFVKACGAEEHPEKLIVVFGAAKFNHASKGQAASTRGGWIRSGLRRRGCLVQADLDEYKSSQHCSKCLSPLKDARIHWQVKRCTNAGCLTTWNRDICAARNMRYVWLHQVCGQTSARPEPFNRPNQQLALAVIPVQEAAGLVPMDVDEAGAGGGGGPPN